MLPDIDQQDWDTYQQQNLQTEIQRKIDSFGLGRMIGDKVAELNAIQAPPFAPKPPEPEPPQPPPQAEPPEVTAARAQYNNEPPTPAPAAPSVPTPPEAPAAPPLDTSPTLTPDFQPPAPQPPPRTAPPATPVAPPTDNSWFGQMLGQVHQAGGDVQKFADNFSGAGDRVGSALGAAAASGANVQQFASNLPSLPPPAAPNPSNLPETPAAPQGGGSVSGIPDWLTGLIQRNAPADLANDPDFVRTVAAGAKGESGWDVNAVQKGGGGRGLFQFDLGGMGAGIPEEQLLGQSGAEMQASRIIPLYAKAYQSAPQGLSGAEKASWVAAQAERPYQYDNPNSAARRGYATAYNDIGGGGGFLQGARDAVGGVVGAVKSKIQDISQFGDKQLSADEAYAACGPAAAVRFAQMYGRNPSLREATDLAAQVGWTSGSGMAGISSEKALMDKMGVPTHVVGGDWNAIAKEAQTGNPVTISTPGHYFFADGYDPQSGAFHVGQSGMDLKGGSEWMTPQQMEARMGAVQGALFADNPSIPAPSTADQTSDPMSFLGRARDAIASKWSDLTSPAPAQDSGPTVNPITGRLDQAVRDVASGGGLNDRIMATEPGAPAQALLQGLQGRLGEVTARPWQSNIQAPTQDDFISRLPGGEQLGTAASALGSASKFAQDVGNEVSPFTAAARVHAGEDYLSWQDPAYRSLMDQAGITQDMTPGEQATRYASMGPLWQSQVNQIVGGIRDQGPAAASAASWAPDSKREELETAYNLAGGAASFALAPEGLASGVPRFLASLAVDPSGAPLAAAGALPDLLRLGAEAPRAGRAMGIVESVPNYTIGSLEARLNQAFRASAANADDKLAHVDLANLPSPFVESIAPTSDIEGAVTSVHIPHLDDVRSLVLNGLPFSQWYAGMAERAAGTVGEHNLPEFATNFGITSQRTRVEDNLAETLRTHRITREAAADAMARGEDPVQAVLDRLANMTTKEEGGIPGDVGGLAGGQKKTSIQNAYSQGGIESAGPKTPSYIGNFLSAYRALFDPRTTNDTWIAQMMGVRGETPLNRYANNDQAYRFAEGALNEIARELGIPGHQAQAAAWYSMQRMREGAPDLFHSIGLDRGQVIEKGNTYNTGGRSLGDALNEAKARGIFDQASTGQEGAWGLPKVQAELQKLAALPDDVRLMPNPTGVDMMRRYAGKTPRTVDIGPTEGMTKKEIAAATRAAKAAEIMPSSPESRQLARIEAESGGFTPTVSLPELPLQDLRDQGLLTDDGLLPALRAIPHRLTDFGDGSSMISLPGGNSDTARYIASLFGDALGADKVPITHPDFTSTNVGGLRVILDPQNVDQVLSDLHEAGAHAVAGTDRGSIHIPLTETNQSVLEGIRGTLQGAGDALKQVGSYQGEAQDVGSQDFSRILQEGRDRFSPTGSVRPDLLERTLSTLRQAPRVGANIIEEAQGLPEATRRIGVGALQGGLGGGYAASQEEGATPEDILRGAALGALGGAGRAALPGVRGTSRIASLVSRTGDLFDGESRLRGVPTEVDRKLWTPESERAPADLTELVSPAGNPLSTFASGEARVRGGSPAWNDISGISRTLAGSEPWTINPPSDEALKSMPNLMHMAGDMPDVRATIQRFAEDNPGLIEKYTQGTITHDELVKDTAKHLGMTKDDFLKTRVGQAFNPQELLALRGAIVESHKQVGEMANYIRERGGAKALSDEEKLGAVRKILEAGQLQAIGRGAVATAGRALNQQKINVDRGIAAMLTRGNELRSSRRALTEAKARQAWANGKLANPLPESAAATAAGERGGDATRRAAKESGSLYDQWIKLYQDELKAQNNFDLKTWDDTMKKLDAQAAKRAAMKDATAEGQRAWMQSEARVAAQDADRENQRAIAAWNRTMDERQTQRNMAGRILERIGPENVTNDMIDHLVKIMDGDNPMDAAKYLQSLQKVSWWDRLSTMRYASMLSSTATHLAQGLSNTGQLGLALAAHPAAVGFDIAAQKLRGGERQRYMSELPAMLRGIVGQSPDELADSPYMVRGAAGGIRQGAADALEIMRSGLNPGEVSRNWEQVGRPGFGFEQTALGKRMGASAAGKVNFLAEGPLRTLEAGDSLIRGAARGAFAHGLAERQAIREGYSGASKRARVDEIIKNFDEFPELFAQADDAAKRVVLQEHRPGGLASGLMSARRGPEGLAMSMVMPFVRTPWNVAAQGAGLTPLGYAAALRAAARGERGEAVDRAARATLGTGILGAATALGANGYLTGGTPDDPSEKSSLEPGWQPYSLRIPHDDGSATFIKYSNLGPAGVPLAAGAIMGDEWARAQRQGEQGLPIDPGHVVGQLTGGMGRYMIDQTMLQGVANAIDAIGDPERKADHFLQGLATQFAPYAALGRQLDRVLGTGPRDPRSGSQGLLDAVMATYPGLSGNVPQRQDPLGRPIEQTQTGLGALLSPATYSQSPYDPYTEAMRAADVGVGAQPKSWRNFAMTDDEQRLAQQQSGYYIEQMMREVIADPSFQSLPIGARQQALQRIIAAARNAGGADIMGRLSEDELMQRYAQEQQRTAAVPR